MSQAYQAIQGTTKELLAKGVKINGQPVDAVGMCILARYGAVKVVGKEVKTEKARGKPGTIYALQGKPGFKVEF